MWPIHFRADLKAEAEKLRNVAVELYPRSGPIQKDRQGYQAAIAAVKLRFK